MGGRNSAKLQDADNRIMDLPPSGGFFIAMWALFDAYVRVIHSDCPFCANWLWYTNSNTGHPTMGLYLVQLNFTTELLY